MSDLFLSIAGFIIKVVSENDPGVALDAGYTTYLVSDYKGNFDVVVKAVEGIPPELLDKNNMLFEASSQVQDFFSIHRHDSSYRLIVYDQNDIAKVQQVAVMNCTMNAWTVYCCKDKNDKLNPLLYPIGPLMLYYMTVRTDSIMIHASGIDDKGKGYIFSGFSGAGKSTMSRLWQTAGSRIINDDRLIIRKAEKGYSMYNTPMFYVDVSKESPLHAVFLIYHSPENKIKKISGAAAVSKVMANCIQHSYNNDFIQHHLDFLTELCNHIPVYEVGFKPDIEVTDFIRQHAG